MLTGKRGVRGEISALGEMKQHDLRRRAKSELDASTVIPLVAEMVAEIAEIGPTGPKVA